MTEKFSESEILKEIAEYVKSTYGEHYSSENKDVQMIDLFDSLGLASAYAQTNAMKYTGRFGRKGGKNRKDILKAIHCNMLLLHYEFYANNDDKDTTEDE